MQRRSNLLKGLLDQLWPITNGTDEIPVVDEIEAVLVKLPSLLCVVNLELAIRRHPAHIQHAVSHLQTISAYHVGCIALMSVPIT